MKVKKFFLVFYLNLMYSAIPEEDRLIIIKRCYWPLLELIERGVPIGIQLSGVTLEIIRKLDPTWIKRLKQYLEEKKCELIGGGYAQIIGPLVPSEVNHFNQKTCLEVYNDFFNTTPSVATISEMAYSAGILEGFIDNGYKGVLMEWNNPRHFHPEWEDSLRYYWQIATDTRGRDIPVIWADSIVFQKFQKYVHGHIRLNEYIPYLEGIGEKANDGFSCLYASDTEIFDYRPRRYKNDTPINPEILEWRRIEELFDVLLKRDDFAFLFPSETLGIAPEGRSGNRIRLESPQNPIPVKKQEKYNLNRWALTGREDLGINTVCYKIFSLLKKQNNTDTDDWRELCYLWSSDFRTHIEEKRWQDYRNRLYRFLDRIGKCALDASVQIRTGSQKEIACTDGERDIRIETDFIQCVLNKYRGLSISSCIFKKVSDVPLLGTLDQGYYDDITLGADFYSGHTIIERPVNHKITDLNKVKASIRRDNDTGLAISASTVVEGVDLRKTYHFSQDTGEIEITSQISLPSRDYASIRPINITFIPTSFDRNSLFFGTHNGSKNMEMFFIGNHQINHFENLSPLISTKYGLGATEGVVVIGDDRHSIQCLHDYTVSAIIPSIIFSKLSNGQFFLRVQYSAQEFDETFRKSDSPCRICIKFKIRC